MPGNANWIIATGGSAGGALSVLLAVSGNSTESDSNLKTIESLESHVLYRTGQQRLRQLLVDPQRHS